MRRLLLAVALFVARAAAQEGSGGGAGADLARFFPADTFAYVEVDTGALEAGLADARLVRILSDPALRVLLGPTFAQLGLDAEKPAESLLRRFPVKEFLDGKAAVGVRGVSVTVRDDKGHEWAFRVAPDAPIDAPAAYRLLGLVTRIEEAGPRETFLFDVDVDFLAAGRPGPAGRQLLVDALGEFGDRVHRTPERIGGHDAAHVQVVDAMGTTAFRYNFHVAELDGTWFLASRPETLADALAGGPRAPLAASPSLAQARARFTSGKPLLLAHVDFGLLLDASRALVPPLAGAMGEIAGVNAIRGLGLGVSLVDGGVRESLGIVLDGNPRGVWRVLEGLPPGLKSMEVAPPDALAVVAVKLDPTLLVERLRAFLAEVAPGHEGSLEAELSRELGLDLAKEVLPAFGDEAAIFVYPPGPTDLLPQVVFGLDVRDEDVLAGLLARARGMPGVAFSDVELPGGIKAVRVAAAVPLDLHYAIHDKHLFLASSGRLLSDVLTTWGKEGSRSLHRDDPVLHAVLEATSGGATGSLFALGYVNLRGATLQGLKFLPMMGGLPPDWFDGRGAAELRRIPDHLTGTALALRHDKHGLVLDGYSPTGFFVPAFVAGLLSVREAPIAHRSGPLEPVALKASLGILHRTGDGSGVKVLALEPGGAAANAGVQQGDRIVAVGGAAVGGIEELDGALAKRQPGQRVELTLRRGEAEIKVSVLLGAEVDR
jgi:hypothetical protein